MTVAEILEVGFRSGFTEGVRHGYWLGALVVIVVSTITTSIWGWLIRRDYRRKLDELEARVQSLVIAIHEREK